jgi:hypothetical protein
MKGIHGYLALLLASMTFIFSFMFKYFVDMISLGPIFRDLVMFLGIYLLSKKILRYVEDIYQNYRNIG